MPGWAQPWRLAPRRVQSPMAVSTLPRLWIRTISRATIRPCRCLCARWDFWANEALQRTHRKRHAPERGRLGGRYGGTGRSVDRQDLQPVPRFILPGAPDKQWLAVMPAFRFHSIATRLLPRGNTRSMGFPTEDGLHCRLLAREPFEPSREMALVGPSSNRHPNNDRVTERRLGGA